MTDSKLEYNFSVYLNGKSVYQSFNKTLPVADGQQLMKPSPLRISMIMAFFMGIFLPLVESVRRSNQLADLSMFWSWFDDYILGAVLLIAALAVKRGRQNSTAWLIGAWGIGTGALLLSFIGQFSYFEKTGGDPGIFSTGLVAVAKGGILLFMITGLWLAIKANGEKATAKDFH